METLKRIWNRILVAFASPTSGPATGGGIHLDTDIETPTASKEHAPQSSEQWKSHGGFRK